jgi:chorismate synthase
MSRRSPGKKGTTPRKETDEVKILSGVKGLYTTGMPIAFEIANADTKSADYSFVYTVPRPSHADYPAIVKYGSFVELRGGGHFSARLTAPVCTGGWLALQILAKHNVTVTSDYKPPHNIPKGDSVGLKVRVKIDGVRAGLGAPHFDSLESRLSSALFGIPAVKAVEFGLGVGYADAYGSAVNDCYTTDGFGGITPETNNNGGITGGITNGAPIELAVTFKPTPSIALPQETATIADGTKTTLEIKGRHDPCVGIRGAVVAEAVAAFVIADYYA